MFIRSFEIMYFSWTSDCVGFKLFQWTLYVVIMPDELRHNLYFDMSGGIQCEDIKAKLKFDGDLLADLYLTAT